MTNSHWHYQLMRHKKENGEVWYGIHEYYPMLNPEGYTVRPISVFGEDKEDIIWQLKAILSDIEKHGVKDYEEPREQ